MSPDGDRTAGPVGIAAASWQRHSVGGRTVSTRLILVGDADFASRAYLPAGYNRNFALNCVAWLSRQQELITVRRQPLEGQRIMLDRSTMPGLYAAVLGAPLLITALGAVVLLRRRGR